MQQDQVRIVDYQPSHQKAFERLNRQWMEKYFLMEPACEFVLTQPQDALLKPGGAIVVLFYLDEVAGVAALKNKGSGLVELTNMAVDERYQGKGLGELLCRAAIRKAESMGALKLIVYPHFSLKAAVNLFKKIGFKHLSSQSSIYGRPDTKMILWLGGIRLQQATPGDAKVIAAVGRESFLETFASSFDKKEDLTNYINRTYDTEKIRRSISKNCNIFLMALAGTEIAGFGKMKNPAPNAKIAGSRQACVEKLYLSRRYQGRGAGALLMSEVLRLARDAGSDSLWLDVLITNERAIAFYEQFGFQKILRHFFMIGSQEFDYHTMAIFLKTLDVGVPGPGGTKPPETRRS